MPIDKALSMFTTELKVKTKEGVEIGDLICIPKKQGRRKMICFTGPVINNLHNLNNVYNKTCNELNYGRCK